MAAFRGGDGLSSKFGFGCNTQRLVTATWGPCRNDFEASADLLDAETRKVLVGAGPQKSAGGLDLGAEELLAAACCLGAGLPAEEAVFAGEGPPVRNFHLHSSTQSTKDSAWAFSWKKGFNSADISSRPLLPATMTTMYSASTLASSFSPHNERSRSRTASWKLPSSAADNTGRRGGVATTAEATSGLAGTTKGDVFLTGFGEAGVVLGLFRGLTGGALTGCARAGAGDGLREELVLLLLLRLRLADDSLSFALADMPPLAAPADAGAALLFPAGKLAPALPGRVDFATFLTDAVFTFTFVVRAGLAALPLEPAAAVLLLLPFLAGVSEQGEALLGAAEDVFFPLAPEGAVRFERIVFFTSVPDLALCVVFVFDALVDVEEGREASMRFVVSAGGRLLLGPASVDAAAAAAAEARADGFVAF